MGFKTLVTIRHMIQGIQSNEYVLPAIQREFVWSASQVERLFDSLLRGYPIGSFLFWQIKPGNVGNFQFYQFMDHYHQRDYRHNPSIALLNGEGVTAILDGQQRLTALNLGLRGWYAEKLPRYRWNNDQAFPKRQLYLNLLGKPRPDVDLAYEFRMLRDKDLESQQEGRFWFPVGDIFNFDGVDKAFYYCVKHKLTEDGDTTASSNLINLWQIMNDQPVINYYLEEEQDLDRVLNIFIRVNSAGTVLSYSDMLLSIATAQWQDKDARKEINDLVDTLNRIGEGFQFGRDFVLKSSLVIADLPAIEFKVSSFTLRNMLLIEERWDDIVRALRLAVSLLASWGYSWQTLPSNNAVIPIAYYLSKLGSPPQFVESMHYKEERDAIRRWLAIALLKRIFSGQSDSTLRTIRRVIEINHDTFPVDALADALKQTRPMYFAQPEMDGLLSYRYGQSYTFIVLSLLYPWLKFDQRFHLDHIYPKSMFNEKELTKQDIPPERWHEWLDHVNDLANLQLLKGLPNEEKSDQEFESWLQTATSGKPDLAKYMEEHLIPDVDLAFENFPAFLAAREQLIEQRLADLLDIQLDAEETEPVYDSYRTEE